MIGVFRRLKITKVAIGISGGVDSAVAALLLKKKGFEVHGVFMKNWDEDDETGLCSVDQDRVDAQYVCKQLQISFQEVSFVKQYWSDVFSYFLHEYENGYTPNPDIMCNRNIKFEAFIQYCLEVLGVDAIATGHYAQSSYGNFLDHIDDTRPVSLLRAADKFKDQTFFLSQIRQEALRNVMFPLGNVLKSEVKKIAALNNLVRLSKKKESTGICFIGKRNFKEFINAYIPPNPGPMIDLSSGKWIKQHNGLHLWTVGQCCGLTGFAQRYFISSKTPGDNIIYVAPGTDHPSLFSRIVFTAAPHFIRDIFNKSVAFHCEFRFQHTKPTVACTVAFTATGLIILLARPLKAITPGQFAVLYIQNECIGSARIIRPGPSLFALKQCVPPDYEEYEHFYKIKEM